MQRKRVLGSFLLGLVFLIMIFQLVHLASAQNTDVLSKTLERVFGEAYNGFSGEGVSDIGARALYLILVFLIVYSVVGRINLFKGEDKKWIQFIISAIIAFLSVAYLTTPDIYALLLSDVGLGFALGTLIPFFILVFVSYDIINHKTIKNTAVQQLLIWVLWGGFGIWQIYRYITFPTTINSANYVRPSLLIISILCFIAVLFGRTITRGIQRGELKGEIENTGDKVKKARAAVDQLSGFEGGSGI